MKNAYLSFVFCILSLIAVLPSRAESWGFAFSGQILETDASGNKVPAAYDGGKTNYEAYVYVRLYDDSEAQVTEKDKCLWGRRIKVHVRNSMFTCELRDDAGTTLQSVDTKILLQDVFARLTGEKLTVGVTPFDDSNDEITPRQVLVSAPMAIHAGDALGTVGDVDIGGQLTIGAGKFPAATFEGPVTHDGTATFLSAATLRNLTMDDSAALSAGALASGQSVSVETVQTDGLTAQNMTVDVKSLVAASFTNLNVTGSMAADTLTAPTDKVTIRGDVTSQRVSAHQLVIGGSFDFFKWDAAINTLSGGATSSSKTYYKGNAASGEWTVPTDFTGELFVSLSFCVGGTSGGSTKIYIDGSQVSELSFSGSEANVTLPFQAFLMRGQTISWSGSASSLSFYYRTFTY